MFRGIQSLEIDQKLGATDYVIALHNAPFRGAASQGNAPRPITEQAWDALLASQSHPSPFLRYAYLAAMHTSASACADTGWQPCFVTLHQHGKLVGAAPLYAKSHSYGEYVFDMAWARAYEQHQLPYYPKGLVAPPFTPVPGTRLMATDASARTALVQALIQVCGQLGLSSLHLLFLSAQDAAACEHAGLMLRHTVQFHWSARPAEPAQVGQATRTYVDFDAFLATLSQSKRKNIRQERRKVAQAGVTWVARRGAEIGMEDWAFFYRCYERTYLEHGNPPYLSPAFFESMRLHQAQTWLLFTAYREGHPIAISLVALQDRGCWTYQQNQHQNPVLDEKIAYGRYWGALARVDCLHFEACYYQPIEWCIANGFTRFEGGAQGEHKMARGLLPVTATSAHWLAHPAFADAVERFLAREGAGIADYVSELEAHSPFKVPATPAA